MTTVESGAHIGVPLIAFAPEFAAPTATTMPQAMELAAAADTALCASLAAKVAMRRALLAPPSMFSDPTNPLEEVRTNAEIAATNFAAAGTAVYSPRYRAARNQLNLAVSEAVLGGSPVRALAAVMRGKRHLEGAASEPMSEAKRPPVSAQLLATAGKLALSRMVPGKKVAAWRQEKAIEITNYR